MRIRSASATPLNALLALLSALAAPALACEPPDDGSGAPWRSAVARVKYTPEVEAWASMMQRERATVQYVLSMDEPKYIDRRCYWPIEVRTDGKLWKRFLVTPDGRSLIEDKPR